VLSPAMIASGEIRDIKAILLLLHLALTLQR
jgi:hypothetical protein